MSKQTALAFITKINANPALQARIENVPDLAGLIAFAEKAGSQFSAADWNEATADMALSTSGELSSKDLEKVAGGGIQPEPFQKWGGRFVSPRVTIIVPCF